MTRLTPETFAGATSTGKAHVLFGQSDPESGRMAGIIKQSSVPSYFVDIDSSEGAQVAMRASVRVSPVVKVYEDGFVTKEFTAEQLTGLEVLGD